jgi:hypothetical protein
MGSIDSNLWKPAVPGTVNTRFQIGKHWFQCLGTASSWNWEPVIPRLGSTGSNVWELAVFELGTRGYKIGKLWFQHLGTSSSAFAAANSHGIKAFLKPFLSGVYAGVILICQIVCANLTREFTYILNIPNQSQL